MAGKGHDMAQVPRGCTLEDVHEGVNVIFLYQVQVLYLDLLLFDELLYDFYQFLMGLLFFLQALLDFSFTWQCVDLKASLEGAESSFPPCDLSVKEWSMDGHHGGR